MNSLNKYLGQLHLSYFLCNFIQIRLFRYPRYLLSSIELRVESMLNVKDLSLITFLLYILQLFLKNKQTLFYKLTLNVLYVSQEHGNAIFGDVSNPKLSVQYHNHRLVFLAFRIFEKLS